MRKETQQLTFESWKASGLVLSLRRPNLKPIAEKPKTSPLYSGFLGQMCTQCVGWRAKDKIT